MRKHLRQKWMACAAAALALLLSAGRPATASQRDRSDLSKVPLDIFLKQIEQSYHGTRALEADFTQVYSAGGRERTESGQVTFAKGGRMRWDYQQPSHKVFVSDGKNVELYLPAENQLEKSSVTESEDYRVPFRLLLSRFDLKKYFSEIEDVGGEPKGSPGDRIIVGIPKGGKNRPYERVLIEFDPGLNIRRLVITYLDESKMEFIFSRIRRNPRLGASIFSFTPPPGTEIIDQRDQGGR
jgi:outer membrane lipoprotein carrier protein